MQDIKTTTVETITNQMKELVEVKESFKAEQLKFIKNLINADLTDNELYMFLVVASKAGLNPFNREIIAVVYNKSTPSERKVNYIVTRDGKRAVASRRGGLESVKTEAIYVKKVPVVPVIKIDDKTSTANPIPATTIPEMITIRVQPWEDGILWGAISIVVRNKQAFESIVSLKEYNTGKNVWATKPETMIKKVAESQALSQAVPELLGLYDETEMNGSTQSTPTVPQIEGGEDILKTGDAMLETLKVLGGDITREWTKQEAIEEIARLNSIKGSAKPKKEVPA